MIARAGLALVAIVAAGCSGEIRFAGDDASVGAVACRTDGDCVVTGLVCDPSTRVCVACVADSDCKDPNAPRCPSGD